jgi:hypothetical protein
MVAKPGRHALHPIAEAYAQIHGLRDRLTDKHPIGWNPITKQLNKLKPGEEPPKPVIISPFESEDEYDGDYPYG